MDFDLRRNLSLATAADLFCYSLCNDGVSVSQWQALHIKRNGKHVKKNYHGLSGSTILIFAWTHWIAFPAQILPGHVRGTGHKYCPLLTSGQLLTVSFTRKLLHAGNSLLTVGTWFSLSCRLHSALQSNPCY